MGKGLERSSAFIALRCALQDVITQAEADLHNLTKICIAVQEGMIPQPKLNPAALATSEDCSSSHLGNINQPNENMPILQ